jgi:hypothetical protein
VSRTFYSEPLIVMSESRLCVTSIKRFFDEDGNLLPINEWTEEMSAQVDAPS